MPTRPIPSVLMALGLATLAGCLPPPGRSDSPVPLRERVLLPAFQPEGGLTPRHGERVAAELRRRIDDSPTHSALSGKVMRGAMKQLRVRDLDRASARRLAAQLGVPLVVWGTLAPDGDGVRGSVEVIEVRSGERFSVGPLRSGDRRELAAALHRAFADGLLGTQVAATCRDHLGAGRHEEALTSCDRALEMVPTSSLALASRAHTLLALRRYDEARAAFEVARRAAPESVELMLGAGLAASGAGEGERAAEIYQRYAKANPEGRLPLARRIAQVGDFARAHLLLEAATATLADSADFQRLRFATAAAAGQLLRATGDDAAAAPFFRAALDAHAALGRIGASLSLDDLQRAAIAHAGLGDVDASIALARDAATRFDTLPAAWSVLATALSDAGRYQEAATAMDRLLAIAPDYEGGFARRAAANLQAGRAAAARADLDEAARRGDGEAAARVFFREGGAAAQAEHFGEAIELLEPAYAHAGAELRPEVAFFLGYSLAKQGETVARAERVPGRIGQALEMFRRAVTVLRESTHQNAAQVLSFAEQYIAALEPQSAR